MNITYSKRVSVAVIIQHAKHMRRILLSSVACLSLPFFFPRYHINSTILGGKKDIEHEICFDFLYDLCLKYLSF